MDIKETLLGLINSGNRRYSYIAFEKIVTVMLQNYAKKQNKTVTMSKGYDMCDLVFPNGIDDIEDTVAVEIRSPRNGYLIIRSIYDVVGRFALNKGEANTLLLIFANELSDETLEQIEYKKKQLNFNLVVWDINKLISIINDDEELFIDTYNNIKSVMLKDAINYGIRNIGPNYIDKRKTFIAELHEKYENDDVVLFLGAGASHDAKIATWDNLISELFVALIDKQLKANHISISQKDKQNIIKSVLQQNGNSPLLQTRFLRSGFESEFEELVRQILYKNAIDTSGLLEEIGQLCVPSRGKFGIRAIINYNFDDLVEKNLKRLRVKHQPIYSEGMTPNSSELGIYHVHGFLPQDSKTYGNLSKSLLVFSEEGYHQLMIDPYNWANISQLNYMLNNTCVFIGLSMTDPNMRRLLEIAAKKRMDDTESCKHYAIMQRLTIENSKDNSAIKSFEKVNESLQETLFKELDINVIWIDKFEEIPEILRQIKNLPEHS